MSLEKKLARSSLFDRFFTSDFFLEVLEYKRLAAAILTGVFVLIISIAYFVGYLSKKGAENHKLAEKYALELHAEKSDYELRDKPKKDSDILQKLHAIAEKDSAIKTEYAGLLAEEFMIKGDSALAEKYAKIAYDVLKKNDLSLYADFSHITTLSTKKHFNVALQETEKLIEKIKAQQLKKPRQHELLLAFALLQKACFEKSLGKQDAFNQSLSQLKSYINTETLKDDFLTHFQDNDRSLIDFLTEENSSIAKAQ